MKFKTIIVAVLSCLPVVTMAAETLSLPVPTESQVNSGEKPKSNVLPPNLNSDLIANKKVKSGSVIDQELNNEQVVKPKSNARTKLPSLPPVVGVNPAAPKRPTAEMKLPGIGVLPGEKRSLTENVIRVGQNTGVTVAVSYSQPNRFSTPFESPRIIDASGADIQKDGSNIYIRPKDEMPFAVYVSGSNPGDPVISLFLIPKNIYPQTVILQLEDKNHPATSGGAAGNDEDRDASSYTGKLTNVLRDIALNKTPPGYSGGPLPKSVGRLFDLVVVPESRYSSSQYDVYVYWVEGTTKDTVHLDEKTFYSDGVRAVAFWPDVDVSLNHGTRVFVVSDVSGDDAR